MLIPPLIGQSPNPRKKTTGRSIIGIKESVSGTGVRKKFKESLLVVLTGKMKAELNSTTLE